MGQESSAASVDLLTAKKRGRNLKQKKSAVPDVIEESIRPYAIAEKLRTLRLRKSMGLAQLAQHTGLSPAMLSRLENARLVPTLPTLVRIALVFDVGLDYFFTDPRKRHVVAVARRQERRKFPADPKSPSVPGILRVLIFAPASATSTAISPISTPRPLPASRLISIPEPSCSISSRASLSSPSGPKQFAFPPATPSISIPSRSTLTAAWATEPARRS